MHRNREMVSKNGTSVPSEVGRQAAFCRLQSWLCLPKRKARLGRNLAQPISELDCRLDYEPDQYTNIKNCEHESPSDPFPQCHRCHRSSGIYKNFTPCICAVNPPCDLLVLKNKGLFCYDRNYTI